MTATDDTMPRISLTNGIELPEMFEGLKRIQTSAVSANVLAALYSDAKGEWFRDGEKWQVAADPSGDAVIVLFDQSGQKTALPRFRIQSLGLVFAVSPQGGWVVSRTSRQIGASDVNDTVIHDAEGNLSGSFVAGGGNAFIQMSEDGAIWIGHDDDDQHPDAKLGGISHFKSDGSEVFYHGWWGLPETPAHDGMPFWCCYALNVIDRSAWAQHYTSMFITRFESDSSARSWVTENNGAVALAVRDSIVARVGRYDENRYRISVFRLKEAPHSEFLGRIAFDIEGHQPKYQPWIDGKGDTFHIVQDNTWYRITLDDVLARLI